MSDLEQFRVQVVDLPSVGCMTKGSAQKYINFVLKTVAVGCGLYSLIDIHSKHKINFTGQLLRLPLQVVVGGGGGCR